MVWNPPTCQRYAYPLQILKYIYTQGQGKEKEGHCIVCATSIYGLKSDYPFGIYKKGAGQ
jgi:hypothetical protein